MLDRRAVLLCNAFFLWLYPPIAQPASNTLTIAISATLGPVLSGSDPLHVSGHTGSLTIQASEGLSPVSSNSNSATYNLPPGAITIVLGGSPFTTSTKSKMAVKLTASADILTVQFNGQSSTVNTFTGYLAGGSWNKAVLMHPLPFSPSPQILTSATVAGGPGSQFIYSVSGSTTELGLNGSASSGDVPPPGSCQPSSSLSVLVTGKNVVSYVPKGSWRGTATGVSAVNIEGSSVTPTLIATPHTANSCASNALTGETVCTGNTADVYLINGTTLMSTLTSSGTGTISFSGGSCTNCGVAMDATHNKAVIGLSLAGSPGFQYLDLGASTFEKAYVSPAGQISEDVLIDPIRDFLLSATENGDYELVNVTSTSNPAFYENHTGAGELDSSGEECTTGIALAPVENTGLQALYLADLTQANLMGGAPGSWTAPAQLQTLTEANICSQDVTGLAVAQGTHTAVLSSEFSNCGAVTAVALPKTSGTGTPALRDWVSCTMGNGFLPGYDPHTVTAYQSPNNSHAIGVIANQIASMVAVIDLTKMLNPTVVPRTAGGHGCASGTLPSAVISFVSVP